MSWESSLGPRRRRRGFLKPLLALLAGAVLIAGGAAAWLIWASLPVTEGEIKAKGLDAPVEIIRDARGVPHIFAENEADAAFALGFVHAQDRLWQMEAMRRFASGRLAEIAGLRAAGADRRMRTLGFTYLVEAQLPQLSPELRQSLAAYAAGVNAWLARGQTLPPEFHVLNFTPEPWRPEDSLLWVKLMAMRLSGNFRDEIARARLAQQMGRAKTEFFWYPDAPTPEKTAAASPPGAEPGAELGAGPGAEIDADALDALLAVLGDMGAAPAGASNAWAVSADLSAGAAPLLANDPHLAYSAPSTWYLARVVTPGFRRAGATSPGFPFFALGHNGHVAWGMTTTQGDQQDVFVERLSRDLGAYETPEGPKPFTERTETFRVKGADEPLEITVRSTERGPVITDLLDPEDFAAAATDENDGGDNNNNNNRSGARALSLRAVWLDADDRTPEALFLINRARSMDDALAAVRFVHAPQQNVLTASADRIGFVAAGAVPVRPKGRRGRWPARGWAEEDQWSGYLPFEDLPMMIDPPEGLIVSANDNMTAGTDYPHFITDDWAAPYRARRVRELLAGGRHSAKGAAAAQTDSLSPMALELLPLMLETDSRNVRAAAALAQLRGWDGEMDRARAEPLIFYAWLRHLNRLVYADDLGALFERFWRLRPRFIARVLGGDETAAAWCDDLNTAEEAETCPEILTRALDAALQELAATHGEDTTKWRWGAAHQARFNHPVLGAVPFVGARLANLSISVDGGCCTVNRADVSMRSQDPYSAVIGPGFRAVYDLADLDNSRFMAAAGQSGNPFSPHYKDLLEDWRDGGTFQLGAPRETLAAAGENRTLRLTPSAP
ncbi:MAG: penicillin acylase family protein [Rhodospirillales bacterium]